MKVAVGIPYRQAPGREKWLAAVKKHYATHFPEWSLFTADAPEPDFNRSASRNLAVAKACAMGADVVVINDADCLAKSSDIKEAVDAASDGRLHYPFTGVKVLAGRDADQFVANVAFPDAPAFPSTGGIYVCTPQCWEAFGGADDQFQGWGGEDDALYFAARTLVGVQRHGGTAVSLGHAATRLQNPHLAANYWRARQYEEADSPEEMRRLLGRRTKIGASAAHWDHIAVVCPSRGRPDNLRRLIDSVEKTALTDVTILAGIDDDDPKRTEYHLLDGVELTEHEGRQRLGAWWNQLALANLDRFDTFVFLGDDNVPVTPGWDFLLDDELRRHDDMGFATGPDGLRSDKRFTWAAISSAQIRKVGYVSPPTLTHLYIDNAWQSLASATDTMWWLDHVTIDHLHYTRPGAGVAEDETYRQANSAQINSHDKGEWQAWEKSHAFEAAVDAIRSLKGIRRVRRPAKETNALHLPFTINVLGQEAAAGQLDVQLSLVRDDAGALRLTTGDLRAAIVEALR